jgi:peroxin-3
MLYVTGAGGVFSQPQANPHITTAISRAYTLLYTLGLLTMLTRVQLNLLGRRSYLSSVVSLATGGAPGTISLENNDDDSREQAYGTDFDVNRKYLTFSWWLLNRGWVDVMHRVEHAVRQIFGHLSPRDTLTLDTFSKLTHDVRNLVEGRNPASSGGAPGTTAWLPFLLPPPDMEEFVLRESGVLDSVPSGSPTDPTTTHTTPPSSPTSAASLRRLLDETSDLIESPAFSLVLTQLLDAGFSLLLDSKLVQGVSDTPATTSLDPLGGSTLSSSCAVLLPKILSVLARQAHVIGNGMPNEYLQAMESVRDLEGFAAVVYSSNWQAEIVGDDDEVAASREREGNPQVGHQQQQQQQGAGDGQRQRPNGDVAEESMIMVDIPPRAEESNDPQASLFDSVWEKASAGK